MIIVHLRTRLPELFKDLINPDTGRSFTYEEIGKIMGVTRQSLSKSWMNPDYHMKSMRIEPALRLAKHLGVEWYQIVEVVDDEEE